MPNYQYQRGREFENKTAGWLADQGMAVMRAAGSKGAGKMDLVAFSPDGRVLIIQCKATGKITTAEWNRLVEIAGWSFVPACRPIRASERMPVVPLVAMRGPRAKPGQSWAPRFCRLAESRRPRSRPWPWKLYDAAHGHDIGGAPGPGSAGA